MPSMQPKIPLDADGSPLKPCCVCLETKHKRDTCIRENSRDECKDLIEKHKQCLRDLGFNVQ